MREFNMIYRQVLIAFICTDIMMIDDIRERRSMKTTALIERQLSSHYRRSR